MRETSIGVYNLSQPGTAAKRVVPAPWIDCDGCGWRHYPSTSAGRWQIATACASCGAALEGA